jgi:hypothetical protein
MNGIRQDIYLLYYSCKKLSISFIWQFEIEHLLSEHIALISVHVDMGQLFDIVCPVD